MPTNPETARSWKDAWRLRFAAAGRLLVVGTGVLCAPLVPLAAPLAAQEEARVVRPGAPGAVSTDVPSSDPTAPLLPHTPADIHFMHGMIAHHAQALEMSALIPARTADRTLLLLGQRVAISQEDEIALMRRWLEVRGEALDMPMHHPMPGMLTPGQMEALAEARGTDFDILFLAGMIQHHEGALAMVAELFASPGAAQEEEIFTFASHVEEDQRIEIARMERMLQGLLTQRR